MKSPCKAAALFVLLTGAGLCQQPAPTPEQNPDAPAQPVSVAPVAADDAIAARLSRILTATGWFNNVDARVDQGIVFLSGVADSEGHRDWARDLARNTEGVVAVVNRMTVPQADIWDLSPAWAQVKQLGAKAVRQSPLIVFSLLLLALTWGATVWFARTSRSLLSRRLANDLLRNVLSRAIAVPIFLIGLYLVLEISGLSGLAVTVLGGTGLVGLIIGFAFRDIAENFLASLLISVQNPFATGDRISVAGHEGYVQSVNARSTLLMTLDGNHVQIPNATIYKETITNYTANPNTRFDFIVGIGYEDSIEQAQAVARSVLLDSKGVVRDPESLVLVDSLGAATVNLKVYFWVDTSVFSGVKVRSAVIRAIKKAFATARISMPDEAREVVFPQGISVQVTREPRRQDAAAAQAPRAPEQGVQAAEGDLTSESQEIEEQARRARKPEGGANLLEET